MKYIDAEKLIKSVNNYQEGAKAALNPIDGNADYYKGKIDACEDMRWFIASHQQEQPKEICHKCIHHGKDDDYCYNPHGGMQRLINENGVYECTGFYEKEEQPEVDLEKEIEKEWKECDPIDEGMGVETANIHIEAFDIIARHFYGLARQKYEK